MSSNDKIDVLAALPGGRSFNIVVSVGARLLEAATFLLTLTWVFKNLGGLAFKPKVTSTGTVIANDTSAIFNWHPLLMSLAYAVFMAEAVLAYRVPLATRVERPTSKYAHAILHTLALLCAIGAIIATFKSHTLKRPVSTPNLYSPHSYLGLLTFTLTCLQYLIGLGAFLIPALTSRQKAYLAPHHRFVGQATFVLGLATMATGIQEKTTFIQNGKKLAGQDLFTDNLKIPASLLLLIAFVGLLVLYHHTPAATQEVKSATLHEDNALLENEAQRVDV